VKGFFQTADDDPRVNDKIFFDPQMIFAFLIA
jgi:hypothetical protein